MMRSWTPGARVNPPVAPGLIADAFPLAERELERREQCIALRQRHDSQNHEHGQ